MPRLLRLLPVLLVAALPLHAQTPADGGLYETRAVWLTTVFGLDWPCADEVCISGAAAQEADLRARVREAEEAGLNTVVFQAIGRADALYPSERLPWSSVPTGVVGMDPGFDPLGVVIEEAHARGMELHVWINVYRIADLATTGDGPRHVSEEHPEWLEAHPNGLWLNPGLPAVNDWLIQNVMEIVRNYDVDAVHFDFIRYARGGYGISDFDLFTADPRGFDDIGDWRRDNINGFVAAVFDSVTAAKPWVKVGATPIGNYDQTCVNTDFTGFDGVFQDSRRWLAEGTLDYIMPQLYWPIGGRPDFGCLADDWVQDSDRHVILGVGAFRETVQPELPRYVDRSREAGAFGQAYFREEFVRGVDFDGRYAHASLPPPIAWRFESSPPTAPTGLAVHPTLTGSGQIGLTWQPAAGSPADPLRGYAVFRSADGAPDLSPDSRDLVDVVSPMETVFVDTLFPGEAVGLSYQVAAVSRLGVLSDPSEAVLVAPATDIEDEALPTAARLTAVYPNPARDRLSVSYVLPAPGRVRVRLIDAAGRVLRTLERPRETPGAHTLTLAGYGLAPGVYYIELQTRDTRAIRPVVIAR